MPCPYGLPWSYSELKFREYLLDQYLRLSHNELQIVAAGEVEQQGGVIWREH
jgi:hypothetical protein